MTERRPRVLVVDDKRNMLRLMAKVLREDAEVETAESGAEALRILAGGAIDVILCDLKMPDMDGLAVQVAAKKLCPRAEFVLMTAYASVGTAVEAIKLGAYDYLTKPMEPEAARAVVLRAASRSAVSRSAASRASEKPPSKFVLPGVLSVSPKMRDLAELVKRVAITDKTALILGETGTGKELVARALHTLSERHARKFVAINCAAIPPELLESELFGHKKGSFSGAVADRKGLFEEAHRGSLFLDEIGEMRPSLQAKLTRVLEEKAVRRVGESTERPVDVRLVAATHRNIEAMVQAGSFREDLFYRLNVASIVLPPLRERPEDIVELAHFFLRQEAERSPREAESFFTEEALHALARAPFPGNVRQLRASVERACLVADGPAIDAHHLPPELLSGSVSVKALVDGDEADLFDGSWAEVQEKGRALLGRRYLEALLRKYQGQVTEAAAHAQVERESFYRLLRRHGVEPSDFREDGD